MPEATNSQPQLHWALRHAAAGIRIFPVHGIRNGKCTCRAWACEHPGKHPRITGWQSKATTLPSEIEAWWKQWPDANIGGLTGEQFVVLDIDPRNGGTESLRRAIDDRGPLPFGPLVESGGGGLHHYFSAPIVGTKSIANFCAEYPGLDFKGQGSKGHPSYIVLPGSSHVSGNRYLWRPGQEIESVELPSLPDWILEHVGFAARSKAQAKLGKDGPIPPGRRNEFLTAVAGAMRARGLSVEAINAALSVENEARCAPPLSGDEVRSIAKSMLRYDPTEAPTMPGAPTKTLCDALDSIDEFLNTFVVFPSEMEAHAVTLWIALTHVWQQFDVIPYLAITSATMRCGKSLLIDLLGLLCANAERISSPTPPVVFRLVHSKKPTLLADEIDTIFGPQTAKHNEELRGIWNEGTRAGSYVYRNESKGRSFELVKYDVFCPKAFGGIGRLPATLADRSIPIKLRRKRKEETRQPFRLRIVEPSAAPLREELERQGAHTLLSREVDLPDQLDDRAADFWECLFVIAAEAGGHWPIRVRKAALALSGGRDDQDDSYSVKLLMDCRSAFDCHGEPSIPTSALIERLSEMTESPWAEWGKKGLTPQGLGQLLKPFDIRSQNIRFGSFVNKGYHREDFEDAFGRYLGTDVDSSATNEAPSATPLQTKQSDADSKEEECSGVADKGPVVADQVEVIKI